MRIIEVIPQLSSGGGERFVVDLCNELSLDNDVKLIVFHPFDTPEKSFYLTQVSSRVSVVSLNKKPGLDYGLISRLRKEILQWNPDVIHSHLRAITYLAPLMLRKGRVVHCHTVHNAADKEASGFLIGRVVRRWLFKSHRTIPVTISYESHRSFVDFYGMDAPMIFNGRNIPTNINVSDYIQEEFRTYRGNTNRRVLINLARFSDVKRQDLIARVCKRLEDEGYDFAMLLIGRTDNDSILHSIRQTGCSKIHILGLRTNPLEYLAMADSYCLMSSYEGMPISLIEALGCGAVPVCTPVGGIVDVVNDGVNGILADSLDEDACYKAIKRFIDLSDTELINMKTEAKKAYAPFSMTDCAKKYTNLFESLLPL